MPVDIQIWKLLMELILSALRIIIMAVGNQKEDQDIVDNALQLMI